MGLYDFNYMDFHPSQIPIAKTFELHDEKDATDAAHEMVMIGFTSDDLSLIHI